MPRGIRRVLAASGPDFSIGHARLDWPHLTTCLGRTIPKDLQSEIREVTLNYMAASWLERNAVSAESAEAVLKKVRSAAIDLRRKIPALGSAADGKWYARHLLWNELVDRKALAKFPFVEPIKPIEDALDHLIAAAERSLGQLSDPDYTLSEGDAWKVWIRRLVGLLESRGIAATARHHTDERQSPFVLFVSSLHASLPQEFRRHTQSLEALSRAISRARNGTR